MTGRRLNQQHLQVFLYVTLILGIAFVAAKESFHLDNGLGGQDWQIGAPQVDVIAAQPKRSLAEVRAFALQLVNRDRRLNGLPPLVADELLTKTAQRHAEDMLKRQYFSHINPEGQSPMDRFIALGGRGGVGENIMEQRGVLGLMLNYKLIEHCQKGWMYSDGHRQNILYPEFTRFGFGIALNSARGEVYAVQMFALPPP
ncbi:MAG: CAP domain-containing protein [Thermosynechococcus sp. Uc]|uniref:CAP domain-containing protein n=1 Tax=Thermosynechococcus sp. Uc TaxID=3034853 RepID=UPI001A033B90|nr:CAP domain-containing protein [Thermosynechococcus sp. Uc]MDM7326950.1 CAP domain-containing protein [Thermosynechococcus sp. Uc]HIK24733.1 CAP domain-containing protein [Thermosynechococcus sp. M46_R2017_013]